MINRQRASDCSDCLILIQTFYLAWWFCPASSDRTLGDQVVSLSPGRKGSFSQTGTSMCHRPTKPTTLRKSRTTSRGQILFSPQQQWRCAPHGATYKTPSAKGLQRKGQESHLLVMTSSKDKVVKDPFFSLWSCDAQITVMLPQLECFQSEGDRNNKSEQWLRRFFIHSHILIYFTYVSSTAPSPSASYWSTKLLYCLSRCWAVTQL